MRPMCKLLKKDGHVIFNEASLEAFNEVKKRFISSPILIAPNWSLPFETTCDTNDYAIVSMSKQLHYKIFKVIYYAGIP